MGFKLNKKNFDFGVGTGSSPNKIGTELLIGGGLEVGNKALEILEKGPNTESGKKYEYHTNPKLGNKPPPGRKYRIDTRSGEIHLLPEESNDEQTSNEDFIKQYKETYPEEFEDSKKKQTDPPKEDPPKENVIKEDPPKEEIVEDKNKNKNKKKPKFRYNI